MKVLIFGVSRGLGKALAEHYLNEGFHVVGVGRTNAIAHPNYSFYTCDLSEVEALERLPLEECLDAEMLVVYNAGILGDIDFVGKQGPSNALHVFQVNYLSAVRCTERILASNTMKKGVLAYISSGAAQRPIPGWSQYCASKAALNLFAETVQHELQHTGSQIVVRSISPGTIDTDMQATIRASEAKAFPMLPVFIDLKTSGKLRTPEESALGVARVIAEAKSNEEVVCRIV